MCDTVTKAKKSRCPDAQLTECTPYALRKLVKAVCVEAPDNKSSGKHKQKVHIEYDLVGCIPVEKQIKEEQA